MIDKLKDVSEDLISQAFVLGFRQGFGENVRKHTFRFAIDQLDRTILCVIADEMIPDVNVSRSLLGHVVFSNRNARLVVFVDRYWASDRYSHRFEDLYEP